MALDAWLPVNHAVSQDVKLKSVVFEGVDWQIYGTQTGGRALIVREELAKRWIESGLRAEGDFIQFLFGKDQYFAITTGKTHHLVPVTNYPAPSSLNQALTFAEAMAATRKLDKESPLSEALYVEEFGLLLPTYTDPMPLTDDVVLGNWLSGGVPLSVGASARLTRLVGWLDADSLTEIKKCAGITKTTEATKKFPKAKNGKFELPGRPYLEDFFNEHVVDIIQNQARYAALGIEFPSAMILYGEPGCGKTFAVEKLVEFLGWPSFHVEASSIASPYIHETSRKVAAVFDQAMENSPSVIVIDEMEAFLANRDGASWAQHRVEEVAEFLRRIPEAIKSNVLIIGMTNRLDMIDPAIRRRGRFDHIIEVTMASEIEVAALLQKLLDDRPHEKDVNVDELAKGLAGRPLSDVAFVIREGARIAARANRTTINHECLAKALEASPARNTTFNS